MRAFRLHRNFFAWLAMSVLLFGALASALSPMLRSVTGESWVEVCTVTGSRWLSADASSADAASHAPGQGRQGAHCPWCSLHTPAIIVATESQASFVEQRAGVQVLVPEVTLPRKPRAWAFAPSRAPPFAS